MTSTARVLSRPRRLTTALSAGAALAGALVLAGTATAQNPRPNTPPAGVVCAVPSAYGPGGGLGAQYGLDGGGDGKQGNPDKVALSRNQLLINQRISQAAIQRVNAVERWLNGGIVATDICGGALGIDNLGSMTVETQDQGALPTAPTPRALDVRPVGGGKPDRVTLSRNQLLINQRISQAAVRRSNALIQRLEGRLTGGDLRDKTLTRNQIHGTLRILAANPVSPLPAASQTQVAPRTDGNVAGVTLSRNQLLINQRISQAAVRRSNGLMAHIRTGLNGRDFANNTITAANLADGVVQPK